MSEVRLSGVSKRYGRVLAVDGVDLELRRGELMAVLGPSGCGKTTLLRLVAGFERPDSGSVTVGGREMAGPGAFVPPERRAVGMVFQDYALFPHLSVVRNVAFGLARRPRREREALTKHALELVGLQHKRDRFPHELSG
ncbi:MAG: ABC transporter ATP-binding protein, partial [Nocardioidaceae bacterium]